MCCARRLRCLRVLVAAMARVPNSHRMFIVLSWRVLPYIQLLLAAFPDTRWAFSYDRAVDTVAAHHARAHNVTAMDDRVQQLRTYALGAVASSRTKSLPQGAVLRQSECPAVFLHAVRVHFLYTPAPLVVNAMLQLSRQYVPDAVPVIPSFTPSAQLVALEAWLDSLALHIPAPPESQRTLLGGYPQLFSLGDILTHWNPDDVDIPPDAEFRHNSLRVFDYAVPTERALAEAYREAEVPFVVRNIPSLNAASTKWTTAYLTEQFSGKLMNAERSFKNHFMYYKGNRLGDHTAPTNATKITYADWRSAITAHLADPEHVPYYYVTAVSGDKYPVRHCCVRDTMLSRTDCSHASPFVPCAQFIAEDLPLFKVEKSFFVVDPMRFQGIHCRFGMPGVIAEAHYDGGRNFIAVVNGTRRYILAPPDDCTKLFVNTDGPFVRHSGVNWADPDVAKLLQPARAIDVVLRSGDVLYVPSLWFHYVINLSTNAQCNARSGTPDVDFEPVRACGFKPQNTEMGTSAVIVPLRKKLLSRVLPAEAPPQEYPALFPLVDILRSWNPDDVAIPASYGQHSSLRSFDYATGLAAALAYADAEVPFVLRRVPDVIAASLKWTDAYLRNVSSALPTTVETADTNHFLYYTKGYDRDTDASPPTSPVNMTLSQWLDAVGSSTATSKLYYLNAVGYGPRDVRESTCLV